jgi:hypothetical protein
MLLFYAVVAVLHQQHQHQNVSYPKIGLPNKTYHHAMQQNIIFYKF